MLRAIPLAGSVASLLSRELLENEASQIENRVSTESLAA
jgi:hypothetical protein